MIRNLFLGFALLVLSGAASASSITYWQLTPPWTPGLRASTALGACQTYNPNVNASYRLSGASCYRTIWGSESFVGTVYPTTENCSFGNTGLTCNASCDAPKVMSGGQCITPPTCDASKGETLVDGVCTVTNPCAAKKDQTAPFIQKWPSFHAYKASCSGSVGGCAVDTCSGSVGQCGTNGETGEYACWGTATYSGELATGSEQGGETPAPPIPEPTTTEQSQTCTAPAVNGGTTTYTCVTESNATEFASSNCAIGTVNGVQGLHCTQPDYVPEHDSKTREDQVTEFTNPDGSKTTTTTSTTTTTHCAAGACNTTTNVTTTTSGKDANGNPTGTTTTCKGDNCDNPTTPGKDESEEEEGEDEPTTATFSGDGFGCGPGTDCAPSMDSAMQTMAGEDQKILGYSDSAQLVIDGFYASPLASALNGLSWPSSSVCPIYQLPVFGQTITISEHCPVVANISDFLSAVFLAIWSFAAIRLFMTA